ncbi:hypothetical protein CK203_045630 [Vitis vinifera]|uniref:Uncharacterized protein n=1 Tax=Vitis vinifera TaxID=29760 RepID=A0A438HQ25_VITVI|nr:hypothetical protein CK203_045630 [Vitis vinifera]
MGTLEIELLIGPATFVAIFQVLRIPTSFNLLLGRPWIHRAGAIPSSLHQKVKFIHDGQVVVVQSVGDMFIAAEPVLEISHTDDDLFLTGFTFDEVQIVEIEDFCEILVDVSMGPSEFIAIPDHDVSFGLGFIPTEADYLYMARLRKERPLTRADVIIGGLSATQEVELQRLVTTERRSSWLFNFYVDCSLRLQIARAL